MSRVIICLSYVQSPEPLLKRKNEKEQLQYNQLAVRERKTAESGWDL